MIIADENNFDLSVLDGGVPGTIHLFAAPSMATGSIQNSAVPQTHESTEIGALWLDPVNG